MAALVRIRCDELKEKVKGNSQATLARVRAVKVVRGREGRKEAGRRLEGRREGVGSRVLQTLACESGHSADIAEGRRYKVKDERDLPQVLEVERGKEVDLDGEFEVKQGELGGFIPSSTTRREC